MKTLSCIIPVYGLTDGDGFAYFDKLICSLSSALKIFKGNSEIIIVNDDKGRINKSSLMNIVSSYCSEQKIVYVENLTNKGQAFSRNIGAYYSSYDYLHFIDQDDYISDDFYNDFYDTEDIFDVFISKPYFCKNDIIKPAYTILLTRSYEKANHIEDLWYLLISNIAYSPGQVIVSKKSFRQVGEFPILNKKGADDFAFFFKMVFNPNLHRVKYCDNSFFYYRIHCRQNSKLSSTNDSACEFLKGYRPRNYKERIIIYFKNNKCINFFVPFFYLLFYKRT